jgi:hypothetical protein
MLAILSVWVFKMAPRVSGCTVVQQRSVFFFNSHSGGWSQSWVHSARRPLNGLLYLPRVIMMMENLVESRLAGETEVLGENLPQRHFVHHKFHLTTAAVGSQRLTGWAMGLPQRNVIRFLLSEGVKPSETYSETYAHSCSSSKGL